MLDGVSVERRKMIRLNVGIAASFAERYLSTALFAGL
jgi:hypothetical protein